MGDAKRKFANPVNNLKKKCKSSFLSNVCFALSIIFVLVGIIIISSTVHKGSESAKTAYDSAENFAAEIAYNRFYSTAYVSAEKNYHVSNDISIEVASIREKANLEVLKVNDVEYVINNNNIETWVEFYGEGIYTVDMKESEFIIDSNRQYVLVRVPRPELTNCKITKVNLILWKNGVFNKSISEGTDLAEEMRKAGITKLNNYMKSNAQFYKGAKSSAKSIIMDLVKKLNPELPDLVVDVEFVE